MTLRLDALTIEDATAAAQRTLRAMGRTQYTTRELSTLARELRAMHTSGRTSMYHSIQARLNLHPKGADN